MVRSRVLSRRLRSFVLPALLVLAACDDEPRCGTGVYDAATETCTCPFASDPASTCELPRDRFDAQAHRGARSTLPPGNTLPAFIEAIRLGVDTLEGDLRVTSDRAVILNHDETLSPECVYVGPGPAPATRTVAELSADVIAAFDCHPELEGIDAPPRLEAVLDLRTRSNIGFDLELKSTSSADVDTAMQALVVYDAACGRCLDERLLIESFDANALRQARASYGSELSFEISYLAVLANDDPAAIADFADVYSPIYVAVSSDVVHDFHAAGVRVIPWTANDEDSICSLIEMGVDGIISDDPGLLLGAVQRCR